MIIDYEIWVQSRMARKSNCLCLKIRVPSNYPLWFFVYRNPSAACLQQLQCTCRQSVHMLRWFCQRSRLSRRPEAPIFGKILRFRQNPEAPIFRKICHFRKFLNRQISGKFGVSSEISGKFGTFGIIVRCIGSIPATSVGFPTGAPTFSAGVPFYVIIYLLIYLYILY